MVANSLEIDRATITKELFADTVYIWRVAATISEIAAATAIDDETSVVETVKRKLLAHRGGKRW